MPVNDNNEALESLLDEFNALIEGKGDEEVLENKEEPVEIEAKDESDEVEVKDEPGVGSASGGLDNPEGGLLTGDEAEAASGTPAEKEEEREELAEEAAEELEEAKERAEEDQSEPEGDDEDPAADEEPAADEDEDVSNPEAADEEAEEEKSDEAVEDKDEVEDATKGRRVVMVPVMVEDDDEAVASEDGPAEESKDADLMARRRQLMEELGEINNQLQEQGYDDDEDEDEAMERKRRRNARLRQMGWKDDEIDGLSDDATLCAVEKSILPSNEPCAFCRGGCVNEGKSLPGLLDIEALAMESFKGEILESGYVPNDDIFLVDIKSEDGRTIEAFYSGSGEAVGWVLLNQDIAEAAEAQGKDALAGRKVISITEAEEIALKSIDGVSVGVDATVFEGYDAWAVQVEGVDGKSYDAYVGLDGTVLGFDEYDMDLADDLTDDERNEIKAIESELYFKRKFSAESREESADKGHALPDGSFPIENVEDLKNAIQAFGRAKNPALAKAHIMKRAAQLGADNLIPETWTKTLNDDAAQFAKDLLDLELLAADIEVDES